MFFSQPLKPTENATQKKTTCRPSKQSLNHNMSTKQNHSTFRKTTNYDRLKNKCILLRENNFKIKIFVLQVGDVLFCFSHFFLFFYSPRNPPMVGLSLVLTCATATIRAKNPNQPLNNILI